MTEYESIALIFYLFFAGGYALARWLRYGAVIGIGAFVFLPFFLGADIATKLD